MPTHKTELTELYEPKDVTMKSRQKRIEKKRKARNSAVSGSNYKLAKVVETPAELITEYVEVAEVMPKVSASFLNYMQTQKNGKLAAELKDRTLDASIRNRIESILLESGRPCDSESEEFLTAVREVSRDITDSVDLSLSESVMSDLVYTAIGNLQIVLEFVVQNNFPIFKEHEWLRKYPQIREAFKLQCEFSSPVKIENVEIDGNIKQMCDRVIVSRFTNEICSELHRRIVEKNSRLIATVFDFFDLLLQFSEKMQLGLRQPSPFPSMETALTEEHVVAWCSSAFHDYINPAIKIIALSIGMLKSSAEHIETRASASDVALAACPHPSEDDFEISDDRPAFKREKARVWSKYGLFGCGDEDFDDFRDFDDY